MDEIHAPTQAILRPSREIHDDPEQQLELVPCRSRGQPRLSNRELREYASILPLAKFLTLLMPDPVDLPLFNTQSPQLPFSVQKVAPNTLGSTLQGGGIRRRNVPANPIAERAKTEGQRAEAVEGDPGDSFPFVVEDDRTLRHERRRKELLKILEQVLGLDNSIYSSFIFLCWGKEARCHIFPVKIPDSADDVAIWQEIQRVWYAHRGGWRKHLGIFSVPRVDIVEVRPVHSASKTAVKVTNRYHKVSIAGRGKRKGGFVGTYTTEDVDAERRRLEEIITNYQPQVDGFDCCEYNPSTGGVDCSSDCISGIVDFAECPEREFCRAARKLSRLKMRPFLTLAFSDPGVAAANKLLDGEVVNRHW
jgi:hypothetical protein